MKKRKSTIEEIKKIEENRLIDFMELKKDFEHQNKFKSFRTYFIAYLRAHFDFSEALLKTITNHFKPIILVYNKDSAKILKTKDILNRVYPKWYPENLRKQDEYYIRKTTFYDQD